jgi:PRTRC genetic system protein E
LLLAVTELIGFSLDLWLELPRVVQYRCTKRDATSVPRKDTDVPKFKTMFTELMPLLRKRRLLLTISLVEGDTIRATVVPQKASDTEDNALTTPLAITGTAEELDRDLPQQLVEFTGAHLQLQTTLASAKAEMEAAAKRLAKRHGRKPRSHPARQSNNSSDTSGDARPSGTRGTLAVCATGATGNDSRRRGGGR